MPDHVIQWDFFIVVEIQEDCQMLLSLPHHLVIHVIMWADYLRVGYAEGKNVDDIAT